jgi:superfamily II DNA or RNA helicase
LITLRPYQVIYNDECVKAFREGHKRIVLCAATGAGKTAMFSEICRRSAERGTNVLILTDRIELFNQTFKALARVGLYPQIINAQAKKFDANTLINVAMIETLTRRKSIVLNPKIIIIDEAHIGNFTKIFERFPDAYVIGATATPEGKHFDKYYTKIVQCIDVPELVAEGYLARCKGYEMRDSFDDLKVKAGEYTTESLYKHFDDRKLYDGVIDEWKKLCEKLKTIVFCVNIQHTEKTCQAFIDAGYKSDFVTSLTPTIIRENIINKFYNGEIQILVNCGILTRGFDCPSIECVIMNRKTLSLSLWLQCAGRGSRTTDTKNEFFLLDFGQNFSTHGHWQMEREWILGREREKSIGAPPIKTCPECYAINTAKAKQCECCGFFFKTKEKEANDGVLVEVKVPIFKGSKLSELSVIELHKLGIERKDEFKKTYIWRIVRSKGIFAIEEYARVAGYKKGWIYQQKLLIDDSSFYDKKI